MQNSLRLLCAALLASASACSMVHDAMSNAVSSTANTAGNVAGQRIGTAIGESLGGRVVSAYQPQLMGGYTQYLFHIAFSSGGYAVQQGDYSPGDYTRWNFPEYEGKTNWVERARLADGSDGQQWWKVKFFNAKENQTTVLEGLFSSDQKKLLRLRGQFPGEQPKEIPVTDQTYYVPPTKLTAESIKGATTGTESVTVPAGTFQADHVVYAFGSGQQEWWLVSQGVPGGLVKQVIKSSKSGDNKNDYQMLLAAYGKDAQDELGAIK